VLTIEGTIGEGGGQILRTSLALSMCLGMPFHMVNIRQTRKRPGLQPQHLMAVQAAAEICGAEVDGVELGSQELYFHPDQVIAGEYQFSIGTAGSTTLLLQTILPALLTAARRSHLILEGGTHNPFAPTFDYLDQAFLPLIKRMGPNVKARLDRPGYYPLGGGIIDITVEPVPHLQPIELTERGEILEIAAIAVVANLPEHIAERELNVIGSKLGLENERLHCRRVELSHGAGNSITVVVKSLHITEVFTGIGVRGVRAELVAEEVVHQVHRYLATDAPVGTYLADQLLLPLALAGGGSYLTLKPSLHTSTNIAVIQQFLNIDFKINQLDTDTCFINIAKRTQ
jgi:RNA 3'-terminal phosphate cyclase (ATP)